MLKQFSLKLLVIITKKWQVAHWIKHDILKMIDRNCIFYSNNVYLQVDEWNIILKCNILKYLMKSSFIHMCFH